MTFAKSDMNPHSPQRRFLGEETPTGFSSSSDSSSAKFSARTDTILVAFAFALLLRFLLKT